MKTFAKVGISLAGIALALAGCGRQGVSEQLTDARLTVERARASEASAHAPGELYQAEQILRRAEVAEDGSRSERHLAYLADRQARIAMSDARTARLTEATAEAQRAYLAALERSAARASAVATARATAQQGRQSAEQAAAAAEADRRAAEQAAAAAEAGRLTAEQAAAQAEQQRQAAQRELEEAIDRIEEVAQVREEPTQTVITIPGEVLFETDKAQLLPNARRKLDVVANSLRAQPHGRIVVTGHADAHGSETYNLELSERRAESVKDFLVEQGLASTNIQAVGRGESQPIADNASPEGRANNRRVEIILPREPAQGATPPPSGQRPARPLERPQQQRPQQQQPQQQQPQQQPEGQPTE